MKKSQSLIISFFAMAVISILFIQLFITEYENQLAKNDPLTGLQDEADRIAMTLAGPSSPYVWSASTTNLQKPGLLDGDVVTADRLELFSELPYYKTKLLLGVTHDYIFFLKNETSVKEINGMEFWGWTSPPSETSNGGTDLTDIMSKITSKYLAKNEGFVQLRLVNLTAVSLVVYVFGQ